MRYYDQFTSSCIVKRAVGVLHRAAVTARPNSLIVGCITRAHRRWLAPSHTTADRAFDGQAFADLLRSGPCMFNLPTCLRNRAHAVARALAHHVRPFP